MRVEWTDPALDDLMVIRDYIAKDSPHYARRFIERLFDTAERLCDQPQMGRQVPEADLNEVRELIFQGYRILYRIKPDHIQIIAAIHGARDLTATNLQPWNEP
ncbi:MAG: type II toxin-antitoxin system RelE/ParE family toxin [Candidatus Thiodiazotropha sp.]|jgi:toxin ParE1/3/4